jgi:hypothetical protein
MAGHSGARVARSDGFVASILQGVEIPPVALIRQNFEGTPLADVGAALREQLRAPGTLDTVRPGARIAITGGSRGIDSYPLLMKGLVDELKRVGARPFVVPAMGSHGGATDGGQVEVLASLGITEASMGCPIRSSMDAVRIGVTPEGLPVYMDRYAHEADGIVLLNRVKAHTGFVGACESGLVKMIVIGLGKQKGAEFCHSQGLDRMPANILAMAEVSLATGRILFGVATVETARDRVTAVRALPARRIIAKEPELLRLAKANMPSLPVAETDVLVVDEIGKNVSGGGMDPHVIGRFPNPTMDGGIRSQRFVVLGITPESGGSGIGLGRADFTTQRAFDDFDFEQTYPNALTSRVLAPSRIPIVLASDRLAVAAAVKTCIAVEPERTRLVRVRNSLDVEYLYVSENLLDEALATGRVTVMGAAEQIAFDERGTIAPFPSRRG